MTFFKIRLPNVIEPKSTHHQLSLDIDLQLIQNSESESKPLDPKQLNLSNSPENKADLLEIGNNKRNNFRSITHNAGEDAQRKREEGYRRKDEENIIKKIKPETLKISPELALQIQTLIEKREKRKSNRERGWRSLSFEEEGIGLGIAEVFREEEEKEEDEVRTREEINSTFIKQKKEIDEKQMKLRESQRKKTEKERKKESGALYKKKPKYANLRIKIKEEEIVC
jgi:hypothetical protein